MNKFNQITEGAISNIYIKKNGRFFTPHINCGLLNGIIRRKQLMKRNFSEKILTIEDLIEADEIYISNAIIGFRKVDELFYNKKRIYVS